MFNRHSVTNTLMAVLVLSMVATQGYTQDQTAKEAKDEKKRQAIIAGLEIGGGPFMVEKNDSGEITSAAFVGGNRISTVFGATKGRELARSRAVLKAKAQFSKWLSEKVTVIESAGDDTIIVMEGTEALDGNDSFSEVGKSIESNTSQFKTVSSAILRGLRTIGVEVVDDEMRVMLYWSKEESDAVKKLKQDLDSDEVPSSAPAIETRKAPASETRKLNKTIKPKRVIIIP
jgi:uncharacterized membrane protein